MTTSHAHSSHPDNSDKKLESTETVSLLAPHQMKALLDKHVIGQEHANVCYRLLYIITIRDCI